MPAATRRRLVEAAFELFERQGFEATSVDQITALAGTGRTTFFRHFAAKEDVVLPDHDAILEAVDARLGTAVPATREAALREGARVVLDHYLAEGDLAHARYRLTRAVPALRARELAVVHRYRQLFATHARRWYGDEPDGALRADLVAAAVISAHNHVLRGWLRGSDPDPAARFDGALDIALAGVLGGGAPRAGDPTPVVVVRAEGRDDDEVVALVRRALDGAG